MVYMLEEGGEVGGEITATAVLISQGTPYPWLKLCSWIFFYSIAVFVLFLYLQRGCFALLLQYAVKRYNRNSRKHDQSTSRNHVQRQDEVGRGRTPAMRYGIESGTRALSVVVGQSWLFPLRLGDVDITLPNRIVIEVRSFRLSLRWSGGVHMPGDPSKLLVLRFAGVRIFLPQRPVPIGCNNAQGMMCLDREPDCNRAAESAPHIDCSRGYGEGEAAAAGNQRKREPNKKHTSIILTNAMEWGMRFVAVEVLDLRVEMPEEAEPFSSVASVGSTSDDHFRKEETRQRHDTQPWPPPNADRNARSSTVRKSRERRGKRRYVELTGFRVACVPSLSSATVTVRRTSRISGGKYVK